MLWIILTLLFGHSYSQEECGLPANISSLPDYAQAELHDIWKNYVIGKSCEKELLIQKDLFQVIDSFEPNLADRTTTSKPSAAATNNTEETETAEIIKQTLETVSTTETPTTVTLSSLRTTRSTTLEEAETPSSSEGSSSNSEKLVTTPFLTTRLSDITTSPTPERLLLPESLAQNFQDYEEINTNGAIPLLRPDPLPVSSRRPTTTQPSIANLQLFQDKVGPTKDSFFNDDYLEDATFDDVAMLRFDTTNAPFLRTASRAIKRKFAALWNDNNIPSESLRSLKIQRLAMSLLNSRQIREYNKWATKRKRVLKAREKELRHLSREAKRVLRKMSGSRDHIPGDPIRISSHAKRELTQFVARLNRRRSKKLALVRRVK
ncbi:hypothetical protein WR25_14882 isoform A [Diploscapter pachys]|uniref:BZIP domain-containing protein n=1 Tax=Diploscapter pachys TaxID=2018661 RepID=A0A2A2LV04_9BILA|nr:hypothetical protein WR25_14882 isoform A [Diploscapter pachys]